MVGRQREIAEIERIRGSRVITYVTGDHNRMLISRQSPPNERVMETIVETLASRVYAHGHAIGFSEARDIGLPVVEAKGALEAAMWTLLCKYEDDLKLREPIDPDDRILDSDRFVDETPIAVVESTRTRYEFRGSLDIRAVRQMPSSLNVTLNLNLPLLPNADPSQIPTEMSVVAEQMQAQIQPLAQQAVNEALGAQAPVVGIDVKFRDGRWTRVDPVTDEGDAVGPSRRDASA